jgi:RNA-directed DNA polymerase
LRSDSRNAAWSFIPIRIVYCKDVHRREEYEHIQFDFLGYNFRPRDSLDRHGRPFTTFSPAMSPHAAKAARQDIRSWRVQLKSDMSIDDLSVMFNPKIAGWVNYYCRFRSSAFHAVARHINRALVHWAMRKFKSLRGHTVRAIEWVQRRAQERPHLFAHWSKGFTAVAP